MAQQNVPRRNRVYTHEGGPAYPHMTAEQALRRSVLACLLWEDTFYEEGKDIATRIRELVHCNDPKTVASIAIEARHEFYMRHVPLLLVRELARHKQAVGQSKLVADTIASVIDRADELEYSLLGDRRRGWTWKALREALLQARYSGFSSSNGKGWDSSGGA